MSSTAIFQNSRTASLIPTEARNKKQLRAVVAAFAEQFAHALAARLTTYCRLSKTKTITVLILQDVADELLGAGSSKLPEGFDEEKLPQTIIYSRFKRNLGGLRTDAKCANVMAVIGAYFLRYVRDLVDRAFAGAEDAKAVTVEQVIASLQNPVRYGPSGLPCIAYRHSDDIFRADAKAAEAAVEATSAEAAAEAVADEEAAAAKPKKGGSKKKAKAAATEAVQEAAAVEEAAAAAKPKKGGSKKKEAAAAPQETAEAAPEKKSRKRNAAAAAAGAGAGSASAAEVVVEEKKKARSAKPKAAAAKAE
jgi:hypothetical protein